MIEYSSSLVCISYMNKSVLLNDGVNDNETISITVLSIKFCLFE